MNSFFILTIDVVGLYGALLNYSMLLLLFTSTLLLFIYLWSKGRLDMDESPKYHVFEGELSSEEDR